ncbi:50S ribosomal protein L6 [Candidatus Woesearchaeota archaeon]|nr:50S ribosomal protein L6 [Candidatus Woesearchaeota archaeon]
MNIKTLIYKIPLPEGATASVSANNVTLKGKKGEVTRSFQDPVLTISVEEKTILITAKDATKREKTRAGTIEAHLRNMIKGAQEGHVYKLKVCSGHFPMNIAVSGNQFIIKNFLGEKFPRTFTIREGVKVAVNGVDVLVEGTNKESTSQCAADIEKLTIVKNRDRRIFQDGIYIIEKDGKPIEA